jgi:hypothetical protein
VTSISTSQPRVQTSHPATGAFRPLHKRAFGTAIGAAGAVIVLAVTIVDVVRGPGTGLQLELLAEFFPGYTVTWSGALIGAAWASFVGFCFGWFFAFGRNVVIAVQLVLLRTRAEIAQTRDFLDHI